jgi:molecular chaperone GrpE
MVRIPITNKDKNTHQVNGEERPYDTLGSVEGEVDGPGGEGMTGGDITPEQDADAATQENIDTRVGEEEMWEQQVSGEVGSQTEHLKPSTNNPEEGTPPNPSGKENTGGASPTAEAITDSSTGDGETDELTQVKAQLQHLAADFENYKRQAARREMEIRERAVRNVLLDLLPVLDNFERAVAAAKNAKDIASLRIGIEYILQQLNDTLKGLGVETILAAGQQFDPLRHEANEEVSDSGQPAGTVIDEAQRGYTYRGEVLRPSRVRVAS